VRFLTDGQVKALRDRFGTPLYVYDEATLESQAKNLLAFPNAFGLRARYAMKACPTAAILQLFHEHGLHIDASSGFEAERALRAGIPANHVQITAQEIPKNLKELVQKGVLYNACSLHQLRTYGELFPGSEICVRFNPGLGSGHSNRTNVGGPASSFGIWHEYTDQVMEEAGRHGLTISAMHSHIGSGTDPDVWQHCARLSLEIAAQLPNVRRINLGGGFKVARMETEKSADMNAIGEAIKQDFLAFKEKHGRELLLELEPGTWLVANAGAIVLTVIDVVNTGPTGYHFIKVDSGMTEILRPSMYGAQHPMSVVTSDSHEERTVLPTVVVGHCCESGDILTPAPGDPEALAPRQLPAAQVDDLFVIEGAGAYCAAQSAKNYNSFPEAPEVLLRKDGSFREIRKRQTFEQMVANEVL
jgi:diaminopimelate decarboxylase